MLITAQCYRARPLAKRLRPVNSDRAARTHSCDQVSVNWVEKCQVKEPVMVVKYAPVVACRGDQFEVLYGSFDC